ncbi:dolichol-phosphate mannosyltransferase subunit 3-like isoform X2 [Liolophura sinensis]
MSKLMEWLLGGGLFLGVWSAIAFEYVQLNLSSSSHFVVLALPIYLLIGFACYSLAVIGYRVATFNDCADAASELQKQINDAKEDLARKGFKFS